MATGTQSYHESMHEEKVSRRKLLAYIIGGGAAVYLGAKFGIPKLAEMNPQLIEQICNNSMRGQGIADVENIEERIARLTRELEDLVEDATPISTFEQLNSMRKDLRGNYKLINDIHCPAGHNWEPIGAFENPFVGTFNGQGFAIHDLSAVWPERDYVGMFGVVGTNQEYLDKIWVISNLCLKNVIVIAKSQSGKLIGINNGALINYCSTYGNIRGLSIIGGLCGINNDGIMKKCSDTGEVDGSKIKTNEPEIIGGLIGKNYQGFVIDCLPNDSVKYNSSKINGSLIGLNNTPLSRYDDFSEHIINSSGTIGCDLSPKRKKSVR